MWRIAKLRAQLWLRITITTACQVRLKKVGNEVEMLGIHYSAQLNVVAEASNP